MFCRKRFNKNITKTALLLALPVFLAANAAFAKAETSYFDVTRISIPADVGKVTETYKPSEPQATKRYIIHIQDLHCNYQAQKNLSSILESLYKTYKIDTILVEGGTGDVSLAFLRKEGPKDVRLKVAEKYLQKGLISGEEYLDIVSDYPLILRGIEDEDLYQKNIDAFFAVEEIRTKALDHVYALRGVVNSLKPYVYGEELLELDNKSTSYHQDKMKMVDFITYLSNVSKRKNISLRDYPNIEKIVELKKIEASIDFKKADLQKNKLIEELSTKAPKPTIENLKAKALQFKDGKITQVEFYLYLQNTAKAQNINLKLYPDLANYISYISGSKQIDAKALFNEIVQLEEKIKEKLIVKEEQRKLSNIATNIRLLIDLIKLKLTPDEYERYKQNKPSIDIVKWQEFLKQELSQYNVAATMPSGAELVQQNIVKFETFYEVAVKRDDALINNAINAMKELGKDKAVLITGGFHTEKMTDKLKSEGFSFAIVAPKAAATPDQEKLYLEVMRYKESHKLREADKLRSPAAKSREKELREITGAMHEAAAGQENDMASAGFIDKDDEAYPTFADMVERESVFTQRLYDESPRRWESPAELPKTDQNLIKENAARYLRPVIYDRLTQSQKELLQKAGLDKQSFNEMKNRILNALDETVIVVTAYRDVSLYWPDEHKYAVGYIKGNKLTMPYSLLFRKVASGKEYYNIVIMARLIAHELGYSSQQAYAMQRVLAPGLERFIVDLAGEDKDIKMLITANEETARRYLADPRKDVRAEAADREGSFIIERIKTGPKEYAQQYTKDPRVSVAGEANERLRQIKKQEDTKSIVVANEAAEEAAISRQKANGKESLTGNGTQNPEATLVFMGGEKKPATKAPSENKKDSTRMARFDEPASAPEKIAKKPAQVVKKDSGALVAVFDTEGEKENKPEAIDTASYKALHKIVKNHVVKTPKNRNGVALVVLDEMAKNYPALVWARANNIQTLARQETKRYVIIDENDLGSTAQARSETEKKLRGKRVGDVSLLVIAPDIEGKTAEEIFKNYAGLDKNNTIFMLSKNSKINTGECLAERFDTDVFHNIINDIIGNISTQKAMELYDEIREQTKALEFV